MAEPATAARLIEATVARFRRLDVLVSNAGFADRTPIAALSDEVLARSVEVIQGEFFRLARARSRR